MLRSHRVSLFCNKIFKLNSSQFKIYDASAGSGKTFTLVKEYLSVLLSTENPIQIKKILAITFTNKAVNEMKMRILKQLQEFAKEEVFFHNDQMASDICSSLGIDLKTLNIRSEKALKFILHNYFYFDVVTIDKFNHRLLKTFAYDLKLPLNFEAAIDTKLLLEQAVDNLIQKAGEDKLLTKVLIDFAISKADDDKSWNISLDLYNVASLLLEENHNEHISLIKNKSLKDFEELNQFLKELLIKQNKNIIETASELINIINSNNLEFSDFNGKYLPNFIQKIINGNLDVNFEAKWQIQIGETPLYPKRVSDETATIIDSLQPQIVLIFNSLKNKIYQLRFFKNFQKNLVPLSLLNAINNELQLIKDDLSIILVSEFNKIISQAISKQPAPFIYERIGEKYQHFFIDEFQDTSEMQWNNLIPLISNALEAENSQGKRGSLMIVGDAKQAIYRWRGGKAEQFIGLCHDINPFLIKPEKKALPKNYRSFSEIINFNNQFFKHVSKYLSSNRYKDLYENYTFQEFNFNKGGYVNLSFVDVKEDEAYCKIILNQINELQQKNYRLKDICILTQKKKHGLLVANFLAANNIPIISAESLLLKNNACVDFLINLMNHTLYPSNKEINLSLILFLSLKQKIVDKHSFILKNLQTLNALFEEYSFMNDEFMSLPLYNAIEYAIACFDLNRESDAYLQYFLDEVLIFTTKKQGSIQFLDYWENKKDSLSIIAPQESDAVQIMTIHKSKGLEFPVVIYPFANTNIYEEIEPKTWMPVASEIFNIPYALIDKNKDLASYNSYGAEQYDDWQEKLELDQYNVLYVALTRAVEKLYIISKKDTNIKGNENLTSFSGLFINFLKTKGVYNDIDSVFEFGENKNKQIKGNSQNTEPQKIPYILNHTYNKKFKIVTKSGSLWGTNQESSLQKGNLYHYILSKIKYESDITNIIEDSFFKGLLNNNEKEITHVKLLELVNHVKLKPYYSPNNKIYNEQAIFSSYGIIKPDRIIVSNKNNVTLIDYKTGKFYNDYSLQLEKYALALTEIGFNVKLKLLVFINDTIEVKEI